MSLPGNRGRKIDYKSRLEHKLYLARENPEPIFDISDCALKQVPPGIYSLCKVFRKRELLLQNNKLSCLSGGGALSDLTLITVMNLANNEFTNLPSDIMYLTSLKELYLENNNIRKLPNEIKHLKNLQILNISKNNLKSLTEAIGQLKKLVTLDISYNKHLKSLPKSLGYAQGLSELNIFGLNISYPPPDIVEGGTIVIIAFLANECGIEYAPEDLAINNEIEIPQNPCLQNKNNDLQATLAVIEKQKEQRQNALLELEKNRRKQQKYEIEMQTMLKEHKKKLLEDLAVQQTHLEQELEKVQQERENNRARLLSYIYNAEKEADNVIQEFLRNSEGDRQSQTELVEQEKREEMEILAACHTQQCLLRTKDTLSAMEKLLEEELQKERKFAEHTMFRDSTAQSLLGLEVRNNDQLRQMVENQEKSRLEFIDRLQKDQALQKVAVATLLERSDARSWSLVQQVSLVESQLAKLTNIELERKKLEVNQQLNDIASKRIILSGILVDLLAQQEKRRRELLETIEHIEEQRNNGHTGVRRDSLFWLMQYQSLMESRPRGLLETLEPTLVRHVAIAGALHCLPFLTTLPSLLPNITDEQLEAIGIHNATDREAVKLAAENYLQELKLNEEEESLLLPSAPPERPSTSSDYYESQRISSISTIECVVCLDFQCEVIFLPCGHLCCCSNCAEMVMTDCPMCRSSIERRIIVSKS